MLGDEHLKIILEAQDRASRTINQASARIEGRMRSLESSFKGVISLAAKVTGSIYTIQKAWEAVNRGAQLAQQRVAFANIAQSYHVSAQQVLADLKAVADGTIATSDMIHAAGQAMMMGIQPEALTRLMEIARATARLTGQEVTQAFNDITLGIARQSKMILDNLGIIIRVKEANERYAAALGKTANELTDTEKKQAFLNAALQAGEDLVRRLGHQSDNTADKINKLKTSVKNLWDAFSERVAGDFADFVNRLGKVTAAIEEHRTARFYETYGLTPPEQALELFGPKKGRALLPPLQLDQKELDQALRDSQASVFQVLEEINAQWRKTHEDMAARAKAAYEADLEALKYARESASEIEADAMEKGLDTWREVHNEMLQIADEVWQAYVYEPTEAVQNVAENTKKSFDFMTAVAEETARNMQQAFTDFFFDAMQGKLNSLKDYLRSFANATERSIAGILAKELISGITNPNNLPNLLPGGGLIFHSGGVVGETPAPIRSVSPAMFANAPRLHSGLAPDEFPAILQRGETVIPRGAGGTTIINYIQATDAQSFHDMVKRNPSSIVSVIADHLGDGGFLRNLIRETT